MTQEEYTHDENCNHLDKVLRFFLVTKYPTTESGDYNNSLENEMQINTQDQTFSYIYNRQHNTYNVEKNDEYYTAVITGK
jgi:hypothetical protein